MSAEEEKQPEIVIIRRNSHDRDDEHKGGMWKVAYADFMTALMALFLVLWLVNASDEETLAQVATYFNPIDLSDRTTSKRGVEDKNQAGTGTDGEGKPRQSGNTRDQLSPKNDLHRSGNSEEALFSDPDTTLAMLARKAARLQSATGKGGDQHSGTAESAGEAFRDPFDPAFRFNSRRDDAFDPSRQKANDQSPGQGEAEKAADAMPFSDRLAREAEAAAEIAKQRERPAGGNDDDAQTSDVRRQLDEQIEQAGLASLPDVAVEKTDDGILISLTDQADFGMFALSSATPKPELVVLMEQLGKVLAEQPGNIILRGHTDARPFRSETYDNWRLSTARAHIARHMLLRGGLQDDRIKRVEGHADRRLKQPDDPLAAPNRRIEILLKPDKT